MSFPWVRVFLEWPARIVELWFAWYRLLLMTATILSVSAVMLMLVLALFGIRFGW